MSIYQEQVGLLAKKSLPLENPWRLAKFNQNEAQEAAIRLWIV
jgi:hypothetical protein